MECIRIKDTRHPLWNQAWDLYENSFPLEEQRTMEQTIIALKDEAFYFNLLIGYEGDKEVLLGLLTWWDWTGENQPSEFRFGEHFAIRTDLRGGGYGTEAMKYLLDDGKRLVILEIDPPKDEISKRREKFYLRQQMVANPEYEHIHPSFRPTTRAHQLLLMSYPRSITPREFREFQNFNNEHVLKYRDLEIIE